jgi:hypothetical protein
MVKCTLEKLILPYINVVIFVIVTFDLWMSKDVLDNFSFMINFLTLGWEPKHITIGLSEAKGTTRINLANQLQALFEEYKLTNKIICYVKNKSTNLFTMTNVFKQIVSYERLGILAPFEGVCFGHALSKACQYATFDENVNSSL